MADDDLRRIADRLSAAFELEISATPVDVLVLGPSTDAEKLSLEARLRSEILLRCSEFGASVKGEHAELIAAAKAKMGAGYNLCTYELKLAELVDLIVFVPASPGSFAELGLFASQEATAPKSILLFSQDYKDATSYIMLGPKRAFEMRGATVEYVDYQEVEGTWTIVRQAIERIRIVKMDRRRANPR